MTSSTQNWSFDGNLLVVNINFSLVSNQVRFFLHTLNLQSISSSMKYMWVKTSTYHLCTSLFMCNHFCHLVWSIKNILSTPFIFGSILLYLNVYFSLSPINFGLCLELQSVFFSESSFLPIFSISSSLFSHQIFCLFVTIRPLLLNLIFFIFCMLYIGYYSFIK